MHTVGFIQDLAILMLVAIAAITLFWHWLIRACGSSCWRPWSRTGTNKPAIGTRVARTLAFR